MYVVLDKLSDHVNRKRFSEVSWVKMGSHLGEPIRAVTFDLNLFEMKAAYNIPTDHVVNMYDYLCAIDLSDQQGKPIAVDDYPFAVGKQPISSSDHFQEFQFNEALTIRFNFDEYLRVHSIEYRQNGHTTLESYYDLYGSLRAQKYLDFQGQMLKTVLFDQNGRQKISISNETATELIRYVDENGQLVTLTGISGLKRYFLQQLDKSETLFVTDHSIPELDAVKHQAIFIPELEAAAGTSLQQLDKFDLVITETNSTQKAILQEHPHVRVAVVPFGLFDESAVRINDFGQLLKITMAGQIDRSNHFEDGIKIFADIFSHQPNVYMEIWGRIKVNDPESTAYLTELKKLVHQNNLEKRVLFIDNDNFRLIESGLSSVFLCLNEGTQLSPEVLMAQAKGIPVVGYQNLANLEVGAIQDQQTGCLFAPGRTDQITTQLLNFLKKRQSLNRLIEASQNSAKQFSYQRAWPEWQKIIK